jgi:hypothetical protein
MASDHDLLNQEHEIPARAKRVLQVDENGDPVTASGYEVVGVKNVAGTRISPATEETLQSIAGMEIPPYDTIEATYPDTSTEVYTYKKDSVTVGTITVTYSDPVTKQILTSVVKS